MRTIPATFVATALRQPNSLAVIDGVHRLTYGELHRRAGVFAAAMRASGLRTGDRVAIWMENRWEWIVAALAAQSLRAAIVPVNTRFKGGEAADILRRSHAAILVTVSGFLDLDYPHLLEESVGSGLAGLPDLRVVVVAGAPSQAKGCVTWRGFEGAAGSSLADFATFAADVKPTDVCDILFTSGTTGFPKGAVFTHETTLGAHRALADLIGLRSDDRYLIINPFFHAFGYKAGWLAALDRGCTVLPLSTLNVEQVVELIEHEKVTVFPGPPAVYQTILDSGLARQRDLSSLRLSITGASQVAPGFVDKVKAELGFKHMFSGYGLTEACGVGTMGRPGDDDDVLTRTNGKPIPGMELKICDDRGVPAPTGQVGEVRLRGYTMLGYLDDPGATAEVFDAEGWLQTGDLGSVDAGGNLIIHDRIKDIIIVGGFNVYPAEVERILGEHPQVREVAAIGMADQRLGEVVSAYIVPNVEGVTPRDIIDWARQKMANFKVPRSVTFIEEMPKTANGKIVKSKVRDMQAKK
jgi:acyl-CoA synthetase (AMP-forming)/AMP-acid ligase II